LDTYVIACGLGLKQCTLLELLQQLGCPYGKLHNAGNDAHSALRAVLLLAIHNFESEDLEIEEKVEGLRALAMEPLSGTKKTKVRKFTKKLQEKVREQRRRLMEAVGFARRIKRSAAQEALLH
jgi:hypothetical protein